MGVPSTPFSFLFFFGGGRGGAAPTSGINASVGLIVVRRMTNKNRALRLVETQSRGAQHNSMHSLLQWLCGRVIDIMNIHDVYG